MIQYRNRIGEDFEKHFGLTLEIYRNTAMLVNGEKVFGLALFPDTKAISDITLQFAAYAREKHEQGDLSLDGTGCLTLTPVEFEQWVADCKKMHGHGWTKQYREALVKTTAKELLALMMGWKMASLDEGGFIRLRPLLVRLTGRYPDDFTEDKGAEFEFAEDEGVYEQ